MEKAKIENHPAFKYIAGLSNVNRYSALTGKNATMTEKAFGVKLEEWPFTRLSEIPDDWASLSAVDSFRKIALIMVFKPI